MNAVETHVMSERRAGGVVRAYRSTTRYKSGRREPAALRMRLRELADVRRRFNYRRLCTPPRHEGRRAGYKLVYRLYREEGLSLTHTPPN